MMFEDIITAEAGRKLKLYVSQPQTDKRNNQLHPFGWHYAMKYHNNMWKIHDNPPTRRRPTFADEFG